MGYRVLSQATTPFDEFLRCLGAFLPRHLKLGEMKLIGPYITKISLKNSLKICPCYVWFV